MSNGITMGNVKGLYLLTLSLAPVSVGANTTAEQDLTVPGLLVGDFVSVVKPSAQAGLGIVNSRVKSTNTLSITYVNATVSPIVPATEAYLIEVVRPSSVSATITD